ncbi:RNase H domain protein [Coprinopsis sp. MPI-PUGE-AT-0042]|nr:RNase H domain protein [Coprinopsis sp. MPI-PUGE-AT-0042]KAH6906331.1 RNase H domain protein [Coprinopsis sp. MPI-PUGE-AT-0042]
MLPQLHTQPITEEDIPAWRAKKPFPALVPSECDLNRRFYPSPPDASPCDLFAVRPNSNSITGYRFVPKADETRSCALVFVDGSCLDNGADLIDGARQPRGGAAVVYGPKEKNAPVKVALELDGVRHTSNRAELRAVLVALGMRMWAGERFKKFIVATDSEYVVFGITDRVPRWRNNNWKKSDGKPAANRDLWEAILARIKTMEEQGCLVQFWLIPRKWNEADCYAKEAAAIPDEERGTDSTTMIPVLERM